MLRLLIDSEKVSLISPRTMHAANRISRKLEKHCTQGRQRKYKNADVVVSFVVVVIVIIYIDIIVVVTVVVAVVFVVVVVVVAVTCNMSCHVMV